MTKRLHIIFGDEEGQMLERIRNKSAYLNKLIKDSSTTWRSALSYLRQKELSPEDILWGVMALSGISPEISAFSEYSISSLIHCNSVNSPERRGILTLVKVDQKAALALGVLSLEHWRGNPMVEKAIKNA